VDGSIRKRKLAEREGFEPSVGFSHARFPGVCLKPLSHLSNLIRYVPSEGLFARVRIKGKLIRRPLKTKGLSVAKLRLADLEKAERQIAEHATAFSDGKMMVHS
jgi:hypothetical protein